MPTSPAARPDAIRRHNLGLVLSNIHRDGELTRAELTQRLGVSRSTVGALVADLVALGLVAGVVPAGGAGVGRPSHVVVPRDDGVFAVAVDIDVARVTVALVALGGKVVAREVLETPEPTGYEQVAGRIAQALARLRSTMPVSSWPAAIGVSVPGTVDRSTGRVGVAPNLGWHDVPFGATLSALVPQKLEVLVGNDADLALLAEHRRGNAQDCDDVVYVLGRTGVGAGLIIGGAQLRGHDGHAGEIGHDVVDADGPLCHCGKHGCVETYVGDLALLAGAGRSATPTAELVAAVYADAASGDQAAQASIVAVADALGRVLATLVNTLNPERILLGGSLSLLLDVAREQIETALSRYALEAQARTVRLMHPKFEVDSALLGAAEIAFTPLLNDPLRADSSLAG